MDNKVNIAIIGFGTVGTGVYELLEKNKEKIQKKSGYEILVEKVLVRDLSTYQTFSNKRVPLTDSFEEIIQDDSIQLVVEVMGSIDKARSYITQSLCSGKHVVTANKDMLAVYGDELLEIARREGKFLLFEASVGGGIPIISPLIHSFSGDSIQKVMGILNGTSNFMLTKMKEENASYDEALDTAQKLGFAESDPSADVEGLDAARKLVILSQLAFERKILLTDMEITGITHILPEDFNIAEDNRCTIKLVAFAEMKGDHLWAEVVPMFVPFNHPLAFVKNENNAVYIVGEAIGETMFYGPGAGKFPTANSIVSDIISIVKKGTQKIEWDGPIFQKKVIPLDKASRKSDVVLRFHLNESHTDDSNQLLNELKAINLDAAILSKKGLCLSDIYVEIKCFNRSEWGMMRENFTSKDRFQLQAIFPKV